MKENTLFSGKTLFMKIALLTALIVGGGNSAWADKVLFSTNFSTADGWSTEDIITSSKTSNTKTIKGTTISFAGYGYSILKVTAGAGSASGSLKFTGLNMSATTGEVTGSNPNYYMAIPVTGVIAGRVTVKYSTSSSFGMWYTYDDGSEGTVVASTQSSSGTNVSFTISGLTSDKVTIYLGTASKTITSLEILTPELVDPLCSTFYSFYKQSDDAVAAATLISDASLPSYITINNPSNDYTSSNSSELTTPHDFTGLGSSKYYRLLARTTTNIVIGALSHVKSIRVYGNGSYQTGDIGVTVTKLSGAGDITEEVEKKSFVNNSKVVTEYSTGDLTALEGYNLDTYYLYTLTFSGNFSLWGLYIEAIPIVTYNSNGGSGTISKSSGESITLSNGTGFTAPSDKYNFAGWNTDPHGTGTSYASGQTGITNSLDLYAVWTQSGTIDDNGGTEDGAYTATYNKAGIEITTAPTNGSFAIKGYYEADTDDDLIATSAGVLQTNTTYTDASGYWTHTGTAPTLYAQWNKTHTLTVDVNDDEIGSAEADETTIAEGGMTQVTATAEEGYKFRSWAVSGTGASLFSTTDNPTTFTMGTADATVTATFSALATYTISYSAGSAEGVSGSKAAETKTEDVAFTLPSSAVFTRSGYVQTGWTTSDGGDKEYEFGGSYTTNAAQTFYPSWIEQYTLTYDGNGRTSGSMSDYEGLGSITLSANTYTKSGYTFIGWATSQANADAKTVAYTDEAAYTLSADATLYAVWGENYCEMKPATSGTAPTAGSTIAMQSGVFGGTMTVKSSGATLSYTSYGLSSFSGKTTLDIVLNDYMKPGSVISITLYAASANSRGFDLYTSDGEDKITTFAHTSAGYATYQYIVTDDDGLDGTYSFQLAKETYTAMIYLTSLVITDCQPGGIISESGWNTYSSNKKLDLSTISGGTAYIATLIKDGDNIVKIRECNKIVDEEEGLLIYGEPGDKFTINTSSSATTLEDENLFVGVPNGGEAPVGSYVFGWPNEEPTNYGFYRVKTKAVSLGAGKSYLPAVGTSRRLSIVFDDETPTGIQTVQQTGAEAKRYYNLQGQRVTVPQKGLYIVNGKKFVNK